MELHWFPYHVPDGVVRTALEAYGKVEEITRDTWKVDGSVGVESTTRLVRLSLKNGVSIDQLPLRLRILDGSAFVVVPWTAFLCLCCRMTGHIRKNCRVLRCDERRHFGHLREGCVKTYATAVNRVRSEDAAENQMDENEVERRSVSPKTEV